LEVFFGDVFDAVLEVAYELFQHQLPDSQTPETFSSAPNTSRLSSLAASISQGFPFNSHGRAVDRLEQLEGGVQA